jgi:hypothetical protein
MTKKLDFKTTLGINQFFSSLKSIVQTLRSTKRMIRSQSYEQTFRGMFGFMLSTAVRRFIWNFNGSTVNTYLCFTSHSATRNVTPIPSASNDMHCSTDANICLQVSAISFSLSMKSDAIGEEKIW